MKKRNPQVLILIGPSGSGKSTFAKYHVRTEENWFRVSRDDYRTMQFASGNLGQEEEAQLSKIVEQTVQGMLKLGINVIIDATNTRKEYLNPYIKSYNTIADISFKVFDVSREECKARCKSRFERNGKHIPDSVLKRQCYNLAKLIKTFDLSDRPRLQRTSEINAQDSTLQKAIICDLDGTLALMKGRNPFDASGCGEDLPNAPVVNMVQQYKSLGYAILLVSGRSDEFKPQTEEWLKKHEISYDTLAMRKEGDFRRDSIVKKEIFDTHIAQQYFIELVLDDRNQVVDFWRQELGLTCFQVAYGDF